jgi:hypothetical protein
MLLLLLAGCGSPTDQPAQRWAEFLDAQAALVKGGTFEAAKFETQGAELVEQLKQHREAGSGKLLMSEPVLEKFRAANTAFEQACAEAGNDEARQAFERVVAPLLSTSAPE